MVKWIFPASVVCIVAFMGSAAGRDAPRTAYPIVMAHGMGGFDDILGYDYWGDDSGQYVLDPCDGFLETSCNGDIDGGQRSFVASVIPFQTSEYRGTELANDIESYMATSGASYVNIVSHSQGGIDARKAARVLRLRKGHRVVAYHISISSPHRGSPVAQHMLRYYSGTLLETLANYYGNVVYRSGNDAMAGAKQLVFRDYDPYDGVVTGMEVFNQRYPGGSDDVARARSIMTAQNGSSVNPALWFVTHFMYDIDGDGYCVGDADGDGAAGCGDGYTTDLDDDGLVGINSQQMGYRLQYDECFGCLDYIYARSELGYVSNLNAPTSTQMTSLAYVVNQDHLDVIGVGPDTFDELEFYAAITEFIAVNGY